MLVGIVDILNLGGSLTFSCKKVGDVSFIEEINSGFIRGVQIFKSHDASIVC